MDNALKTLETRTQKMYRDVLTPLGASYYTEINTPRQRDAGRPTVLFLGNHSSGKSTFINFLLGRPGTRNVCSAVVHRKIIAGLARG